MKILLTKGEAEEIIHEEITRRVAGSQFRTTYTEVFTYTDGTIGVRTNLHMRDIRRRKPKKS
mgnify:CR=1 FL=1